MTRKYEHLELIYNCAVRIELNKEGFPQEHIRCGAGKLANCRSCGFRKRNEWVWHKEGR